MTPLQLLLLFLANIILGLAVFMEETKGNLKKSLWLALLVAALVDIAIIIKDYLIPFIAQTTSEQNPTLSSWLSNNWIRFFVAITIVFILIKLGKILFLRFKTRNSKKG